ncbi:hypothetical protein WN982_29590 [Paraburkholderia sp. IMGN_8]
MTYLLYYSPGAASMAVHWMLIEMGIALRPVSSTSMSATSETLNIYG